MVSILNFDEVYARQSFYRQADFEWIDLSQLRNVNGYCEPEALKVIKEKLRGRRNRGITFIGGGNYHYVTYLLLTELAVPFTLVLLDYHTDLVPGLGDDALLSCGSWVLRALADLTQLKQVVMIGVNPELAATVTRALVGKVRFHAAGQVSVEPAFIAEILNSIPTDTVYISIDKDVLDPQEAATDWEQGKLTLAELLQLVKAIGDSKRIAGLDVCGELAVTGLSEFYLKQREGEAKNNQANLAILNLFLSMNIGKTKCRS